MSSLVFWILALVAVVSGVIAYCLVWLSCQELRQCCRRRAAVLAGSRSARWKMWRVPCYAEGLKKLMERDRGLDDPSLLAAAAFYRRYRIAAAIVRVSIILLLLERVLLAWMGRG